MPVDIGVKLNGDNSDFRSMMDDSVRQTAKLESVLKKFGVTAIGLQSLRSVYEGVLEFATKSEAGIDQNIDAVKRYVAGTQELKDSFFKVGVEVMGTINRFGEWIGRQAAIVKYGREQVELNERIARQTDETLATIGAQRKLVEESLKIREKVADVERKTAAESEKLLDLDMRRALAQSRIQAAKDEARRVDGDIVAMAKADLELAQARAEAQKVEAEAAKRAVEERKKSIEVEKKAADDQAKTLQEIARLRFEGLSTEEKIATYLESMATATKLIAEGKRDHVNTDFEQLVLLQNQVEVEKLQIQLAKERARTEEAITHSIEAQVTALRTTITRTGSAYEQQSTSSLEGARERIVKQLSSPAGPSGLQIKDETVNGNYGAFAYASVLRGELAQIQSVLAQRATIQGVATRYGDATAVRAFGDTATNQALRDMQDSVTQTAQGILELNQRLANSGLFPSHGPRG